MGIAVVAAWSCLYGNPKISLTRYKHNHVLLFPIGPIKATLTKGNAGTLKVHKQGGMLERRSEKQSTLVISVKLPAANLDVVFSC